MMTHARLDMANLTADNAYDRGVVHYVDRVHADRAYHENLSALRRGYPAIYVEYMRGLDDAHNETIRHND